MTDPIRERRARMARLASRAQRLGYVLFLAAMAAFAVALATRFSDTWSTVVLALLVAGSVVLAPAIILGYAVRAAEREDRERGL